MNTANKITILRICLIPILIILLLINAIPNRFFLALCVFLVAAFTDHLDGKIARKYGQITDLGKFLDPLADKMLVMAAFICFVELNLVSSVPVIIILLREFLVTSIRLVAVNSGKVVAANMWGKIKTTSQIIAISIILLFQCFLQNKLNINLELVKIINFIFIWVSVFFTILSGAIYVKENLNFIKSQK